MTGRQHNSTRGYVLLLAVLISSIVLALGIGLLNIVNKELILASIGENSQRAFYAADSGWECAFFWHIRNPNGPDSWFSGSGIGTAECSGDAIPQDDTAGDLDGDPDNVRFEVAFLRNGSCAEVTVELSPVEGDTVIESLGYSHGTVGNCPAAHPRQTERAIRATLQ